MLKNILNLEGAQQLSKNEQNAIHGGGSGLCIDQCYGNQGNCPDEQFCHVTMCYPAGPGDPDPHLYGTCVGHDQ